MNINRKKNTKTILNSENLQKPSHNSKKTFLMKVPPKSGKYISLYISLKIKFNNNNMRIAEIRNFF